MLIIFLITKDAVWLNDRYSNIVIMKRSNTESKTESTEIYAWGGKALLQTSLDNTFGQLGIISKEETKVYTHPKFFSLNIRIKSISCGEEYTALLTRYSVLSLLDEGFLYTMGNNLHGQLGLGESSIYNAEPRLVESLMNKKIVAVACGVSHTIAITDKDEAYNWGLGTLGTNTTTIQCKPILIDYFSNKNIPIVSAACGAKHSVFLTRNNKLKFRQW